MRWLAAAVLAALEPAPAPGRTVRGPRVPGGPVAPPDASEDPPVTEVPPVPLPPLDSEQRAASAAIAKALAAHPLSPALRSWRPFLLAVLQVNAWHESRLRPAAANTAGEDSHGLFQLNRTGGVGQGHAVADLQDPVRNTTLILDELVTRFHSDSERARMQGAQTIGDLVAAFAALVERPGSDKHPAGHIVQGRWQVGEARKATLASWSPSIARIALPGLSAGLLPAGDRLA